MPESATPQRRAAALRALRARWDTPGSRARASARILHRYEVLADPAGLLAPADRHHHALQLLRADMTRLSHQAAAARSRRAAGTPRP